MAAAAAAATTMRCRGIVFISSNSFISSDCGRLVPHIYRDVAKRNGKIEEIYNKQAKPLIIIVDCRLSCNFETFLRAPLPFALHLLWFDENKYAAIDATEQSVVCPGDICALCAATIEIIRESWRNMPTRSTNCRQTHHSAEQPIN